MLDGKVALVTGGARGIGFAIARVLAKAGAKVVISDLDEEALTKAKVNLQNEGHSVQAVAGNVAIVADCEAMVDATLKTYGQLNILVNNAGGSAGTPANIEDVTEEEYDKVMNWNVRGTFFCTKAALPALKVAGGSIINMTSMSGRMGAQIFSPQYSAAKAAIVGITRNLAKKLGSHQIRVNAIAPGFIASGERANGIWETRDNSAILSEIALGRRGDNDDLADVALFLASDLSRYVSGVIIDVNGGYVAL
jgi:NAD(P)-dependent dehydrogenase (short-subunit alcohol dehydrogenase family)